MFILFFQQVFQITLDETNGYFHKNMAARDRPGPSTQPCDITMKELFLFFTIITQLGHDQRDSLKDYWSRDEQYYTTFYSNVIVRHRFFHILRFLHFENNDDSPSQEDPENKRLWKIRKSFDILNNKFCEFYNPTEHLSVDEVIVLS
jgi:hypothetical protein